VDCGYIGAISGSNKSKMAAAAILDNFEWPYLRNGSYDPLIDSANRAVIFAISQLSCITARCYAEGGIATASRLSVCPSVRDVEVS